MRACGCLKCSFINLEWPTFFSDNFFISTVLTLVKPFNHFDYLTLIGDYFDFFFSGSCLRIWARPTTLPWPCPGRAFCFWAQSTGSKPARSPLSSAFFQVNCYCSACESVVCWLFWQRSLQSYWRCHGCSTLEVSWVFYLVLQSFLPIFERGGIFERWWLCRRSNERARAFLINPQSYIGIDFS